MDELDRLTCPWSATWQDLAATRTIFAAGSCCSFYTRFWKEKGVWVGEGLGRVTGSNGLYCLEKDLGQVLAENWSKIGAKCG
ncbi:hypothetical protein KY289_019587 [Solanum tuberosum]|nr:hypothetical protein KY289_019587 [Solanum tuberosum]